MNQQRIVFVSGHMDLTEEEFAQHYEPRIREAAAAGARFVVGDARGCDFMAQRLLHELGCGVDRVHVFHMLERPRHSFSSGFPLFGGFKSDEERDAAMTASSTEDIAWVRPVKKKLNSGTVKNLARRRAMERVQRWRDRATWPVFNVDPNDMTDGGERFVNIKPAGEGYGDDVPLPPDLVNLLIEARAAVADARAIEHRFEEEVRKAVRLFKSDRIDP